MNSSYIEREDNLPSAQVIDEHMVNNTSLCQRSKKKILLSFGIILWIIICIPSNIVAGVFYFKQNNTFFIPTDVTSNISINSTHELYELEKEDLTSNINAGILEVLFGYIRNSCIPFWYIIIYPFSHH